MKELIRYPLSDCWLLVQDVSKKQLAGRAEGKADITSDSFGAVTRFWEREKSFEHL